MIALEGELFLVIYLLIAGPPALEARRRREPGKIGLAAFDFSTGTLTLTEAGTKQRASLDVVRGESALRANDTGRESREPRCESSTWVSETERAVFFRTPLA